VLEKGVFAFEKSMFALEKGVFALEKDVFALEGVYALETGGSWLHSQHERHCR